MAAGFVPGVATVPRSRSAASARLMALLILWAGSDLFGWLVLVGMCLAGLAFLAGVIRIQDHPIAEFAGPEAIKGIGKIHWAVWGVATVFASIVLAQAVGELAVGALSITQTLLALCYVVLEYAWVLVIVSWWHSVQAFREFAWPKSTRSFLARLLIFAACVSSTIWLTRSSIGFFWGTVPIDFAYATATAATRAGKPMDPMLKEEGKNSSLYMALRVVATPKRCMGRDPEDLYIGLDTTRQFVLPHITTRSENGHFVANTNELDGSRVESECRRETG